MATQASVLAGVGASRNRSAIWATPAATINA
jgi:hypothetical protein